MKKTRAFLILLCLSIAVLILGGCSQQAKTETGGNSGAAADAQWMIDNGHTFYVIPDDERERWVKWPLGQASVRICLILPING